MRKLCLLFILCFLTSLALQAHSGCCSSHGGVCGCSCCDGSPLSDVCLPYYPNCGGGGGGGGGSLTAPSNLAGSAASSTACTLTWNDNSSGENYFYLEDREVHQSQFALAQTVTGNTTAATIDHLSPGTSYVFRVRAHGGGTDSPYSNETTITTFPDPGTLCRLPATCFNQSRYNIAATWKTSDGRSGAGTVVRLSDDSGYFWFFDPSNVEVVFKVINACSLNHAYWFYAGGLTSVQVTITVTDTKTGSTKTYSNPQGKAFQPVQDVTAFSTCP